MRNIILILLLFFIAPALAMGQTQDWHTAKSTHFIIYYQHAEEDFIDRLIEKAEGYYNDIADDLGFRRYNFWLWDNRAKIYIYDDAKDYHSATKQPEWSSGHTVMEQKIIYTFPYARGFFETTLPHEMGHIIFREFVGFDNKAIPLWLDEGVASYQEKIRRSVANMRVREAIKNNNFMDLERLASLEPSLIQDTPTVNLFYDESLSIVDYLIKEFGSDSFALLCQVLRDKKDLNQALSRVYSLGDIQALSKAWRRYLSDD